MKKKFLVIIFLITVLAGYAADREKYDWEEQRKRYEVGPEDLKVPAVVLKDKRIMETIFQPMSNSAEQELAVYKTVHKIILVNTDEAIDQFNKVYIQIHDENSLIDIKARSISKSGKVTVLNKNSLKEMKSGEELAFFKIFVIEGLEVGSEIEYIYTIKKNFSIYGREMLQTSTPSRNVSLDIISPEHLEYEAKGYNGIPTLKDTIHNEKRFLSLSVDSIDAAVDEEYAVYDANLKRVDYKLAYNLDRGRVRLFTWADASQNIFKRLCVFSSSELSKVKKEIKSKKFNSLSDTEAKIKAVENYIKNNYVIRNGNTDDFLMVDKIIANKYGDEFGIIRLFEAILSALDIDHRIVMTSDRSDCKFDGKFDSWVFLDKTMFYFPSTNKYLTPTMMEMRYGMVPYYWTNNEGLFIKKVKIGDTETSVGEVKFIPALTSDLSPDNIYANIVLTENLDNVDLHVVRKIGGYNAIMFQPYYKRIDAEKQKELNDNLMQFISKDAEVSNVKVQNIDPNESLLEKPFIIEGDIKLSSLIENAGNKYFFKVGDVLGRQSELYSEKKRVNPVENDFNRVYIREIKVKIPEGYTFKNLDDIKKNVAYEDAGEKTMGFVSEYKLEGNMLIITINEYYNRINFPLSMYEDFRKVINAAADFNKVVLILEKTN